MGEVASIGSAKTTGVKESSRKCEVWLVHCALPADVVSDPKACCKPGRSLDAASPVASSSMPSGTFSLIGLQQGRLDN